MGACPRPSLDEDASRRRRADSRRGHPAALDHDDGHAVVASSSLASPLHRAAASINTGHPQQALDRTGPLLIADLGMGRAEGAASHRSPAQAEARFPGMAIGPTALAEADRQDGRRRAGRRRDRRQPGRTRRPGLARPRRTSRRLRGDYLLPTPLRPRYGRRVRVPRLRSAGQAEAIDLAQDGAAGDAGSQDAGDPGGGTALLPEGDQLFGSLRGPDGGGHCDAPGQQAQSARPPPPFLLPPETKKARRFRAGPID